ncbi:MAG: DUF2953 domain-containing protein [Lachnospiraceae bacterium]|nr:DUF2953 domain-containing protein [Lachnospiraceae bacterium]
MLHIILTILKIIGILLLVLLALILFVTAAVLFVPVRYRLNGGKEGDNLSVRAEVFWFMHLLRARAIYPVPGRIIVKLLWFTLYDSGREEKTAEKEKKQKGKKQKKKKSIEDGETEEKQRQQEISESAAGESIAESGKESTGKERDSEEQKTREQKTQEQRIPEQKTQEWKKQEWKLQEQWEHRRWLEDDSGDDLEKNIGDITEDDFEEEAWEEEGQLQEEQEGFRRLIKAFAEKVTDFFEKIADILRKIKNAVKNIWYTIKRLCDRIVEVRNNINYYIEVFGEEETKQAFLICRQELNRIWKNIRPTKCRAELIIGTGEPDTTGYILAMHGILYPIIGNDIVIEPDFENQILEGKLFLKGRVTVFVLLRAVIKIYFDKNIRYFLKRFKREEA